MLLFFFWGGGGGSINSLGPTAGYYFVGETNVVGRGALLEEIRYVKLFDKFQGEISGS